MKMFALFFPVIKFFIHYLFIYVCLSFFQPWWCSINNQWEIGTEIFRITGKQNINHAVFSIELTVSEMLQWLSVNRDVTKSLLPANFTHQKRPYHQLKLLWNRRQRHGVILKEQLSEKDALTYKKACPAFPQLHPWVKSPLNLQSNHILCV